MDFPIELLRPGAGRAAATSGPARISVVVPVFNEAAVLPAFHERLSAALAPWADLLEVLYVDDGSADTSVQVIKSLRGADPSVALLRLSRNFGKEVALSAGLQTAGGDAVVVIDADLQDPPELIPSMIEQWLAGAEMVLMRRSARAGESWFKRTSAHVFYRLLNRLGEIEIPADVGDFRLVSRRVVDALNDMPESQRYMKGLFAWVGFEQVTLDYDRPGRAAGKAGQSYWRLWSLAGQGITSFSFRPLRLASVLGMTASAIALATTAYYVIKTLLYGDAVQGFPTLIVAILLLGGLQLLSIGVLGEYLGRMFMETKRRPLYLQQEYLPAARAAMGLPLAPLDARRKG
jgi:glycosyltransferase involved in cell wall biosynthesis